MADFEDGSIVHKVPNSKSQRPYQASVGGSLSNEQNRRCHLERLHRIRVMQMRRKLPPQLEPLHGIGLGSKRDSKPPKEAKQLLHVPPTTYHMDWMKGNNVITPITDQEKAISSWTQKHLGTVVVEPLNEAGENFPIDIRTLLRRTRHSGDSAVSHSREQEKKTSARTITPSKTQNRRTGQSTRLRSEKAIDTPNSKKSDVLSQAKILSPPPPPASSPSPQTLFMSEIISHHSSSSSQIGSEKIQYSTPPGEEEVEDEVITKESNKNGSEDVHLVDKASSPVRFRLPPLEKSARSSISSSANSKKHIVVKIPHGNK